MIVKSTCDRAGKSDPKELEMAHPFWKCREARSRVRLGTCDALLEHSVWSGALRLERS